MFDDIKRNVGKLAGAEKETPMHENTRSPERPTRSKAHGPTATIGPSIHIKGDVTGEENLVIEGTVDGAVKVKNNDVTIGVSGKVKANIYAASISVEGELNGDLIGEDKVIIRNTGKVQGNIVSPRVSLEEGAKFKGSIDMDPKAAIPAGAPKGKVETAEIPAIKQA